MDNSTLFYYKPFSTHILDIFVYKLIYFNKINGRFTIDTYPS